MSCCGSLFVNLGGGGGGTVNTGVLQIAGGVSLDATLRFVEDQAGTDSAMQLSTTSAKILGNVIGSGAGGGVIMGSLSSTLGGIWGNVTPSASNFGLAMETNFTYLNAASGIVFTLSGAGGKLDVNSNGTTIGGGTANGALTVKGAGSNIASFRDSANVEVAFITNSGQVTTPDARISYLQLNGGTFYINSRGYINFPADGITLFSNDGLNGYTRQQFGGSTTSFPAFSFTNTPATIAAKDATGANLIPFSAEDFTSGNLSSGTLITARPMQFGDKGTVTIVNDLGLDAQIAVEHNGNVYYIPCSTSLIT
jgi:hypothetical protein